MQLFALSLVTFNLLVRPSEVYAPLQAVSPYELSILLMLALGFQTLFPQFQGPSLERSPMTLTFIVYFFTIIFCHLGNGQVEEAATFSIDLLKMMLYYFLMVGILSTKKRLISFLMWATLSCGVAMLVGMMHFWKYFEIPGQENLVSEINGVLVERMGGTGLLKDPNEMAVMAASFMPLSLYFAFRKQTMVLFRPFWLWLTFFLFQSVQATASRGGVVSIGAAVIGFTLARLGRKGLLILPLLPLGLLLMPGRQGDLSVSSGTGQERIRLQHEGLAYFFRTPIVGVGANHYHLLIGSHVAHNSFLQAYTETGIMGGATFFSTYLLWLMQTHKLTSGGRRIVDDDLRKLRPYLVAMAMAQIAAKMSLSQNYQVPTFMFWGIMAAYLNVTATDPPIDKWFKQPIWAYWLMIGVGGVVFFYIYLNALINY